MINSSNDYHGKIISVKENEKKVLYYLYKLNKLIDDKLHKQNFLEDFRTEINQSLSKNNNQNQFNIDTEENETDLLNQIKNLLNLINEANKEFKINKTKFLKSKTKKFSGLLNKTNNKKNNSSKSLPRKINSFSNLQFQNNLNNKLFTFSSENLLKKKTENIKNLKLYPPVLKNSISDLFKNKKKRKIKNVVLSPQINNCFKKESSFNHSNNLFHSRTSSHSTLFTNRNNNNDIKYNDDNYEDLLEMAFNNLLCGKNKETIKCLKKCLQKIKNYSNEELENIWKTGSNENLLTNVGKIKDIINKGKIQEKTEKIYLSNEVIQRIKPKLKNIIENEKKINNFEKEYVKSLIINQ